MTKTLRALPLALMTVTLFPGCNCDQVVTEVPGDLQGRVCTLAGEPLVGAAVTLTGRTERASVSNGNGEYTFTGLPPGRYDVTATLGELVRPFVDNEVASSETAFVTDTACRPEALPGQTGILDGQICNRHTGALVTQAEVLVQLADGGLMVDSTDVEGRFQVNQVPTGQHIVSIRGEGFQRAFAIEIIKDQTTSLDLAEDCESVNLGEGGIIGSFCDLETGGNLMGAAVTVKPALGGPNESEQHDITDIEGEFEINGLIPGVYDVEVRTDSYAFDQRNVTVVAGELSAITDVASCGVRPDVGRIKGQFCDSGAGGTFVGNIELKQGNTIIAATQTAPDGRFSFEAVAPGTYDLRASRVDPAFERTFAGVVVVAFRAAIIDEGICPELQDVCSEFENAPSATADGRILLVVDKSGSMSQDFSGDPGVQKWEATRQALINVTASLTTTVEFGLVLFPERGGDLCQEGSQVLAMAPNNANQIQNELNATSPEGGTPTAPSLAAAKTIVAPLVADNRPIAVVLATDGGPNCNDNLNTTSCTCTDPFAQFGCPSTNCLDEARAYEAVTAIKNIGVNTFIVGITGVDSFEFVLDEMAVRGGTARQGPPGSAKYYEANDVAALEQALAEITRRVTSCLISPPVDLGTASSIEVSIGQTVIAQDSARQNGWAATGANTIELFGSACDLVVASLDNVKVRTCVAQ